MTKRDELRLCPRCNHWYFRWWWMTRNECNNCANYRPKPPKQPCRENTE